MDLIPFAIIHIGVSLALAANLLLVYRRIHKTDFLIYWAFFWVGIALTLVFSQVMLPMLGHYPRLQLLMSPLSVSMTPFFPILMICSGLSIGGGISKTGVRRWLGFATAVGLSIGLWRYLSGPTALMSNIAWSRTLMTALTLVFFIYRLAAKGGRETRSAHSALVGLSVLYCIHNFLLAFTRYGVSIYPNASYSTRSATVGILLQFGLTLAFSYVAVETAEIASGEAREAGRRLHALLESVGMAGLIVDRNGRVEFCNRWLADALGLPQTSIVGTSWLDRFVPSPEREGVRKVFKSGFQQGQLPAIHEYSLSSATAERQLDISWYHTLLRDSSGTVIGMASLGTDLGQQKRLDAQVQQAQKMETLGRLAGGVAHDFNNHLTVINGFADLLLDRLNDETAQQQLKHIRNSGEVARNLTQQLLTFSRRRPATLEHISLNERVTNSVAILRRLIRENVALETDLMPGGDLILADPGHVDQVLLNLVINANDAIAGAGRIQIRTRTFIGVRPGSAGNGSEPHRFAAVDVEDNGLGMDEWTRGRIFEPFFTTKAEGKGTGLGLATIHGAVAQAGGWIDVTSKPGKGSVFSVYWPRVEAPGTVATRIEKKVSARASGGTILLVEDQDRVREFALLALKKEGHQVLEATNADEALRIASDLNLELSALVTDVVMPGMSGDQLAHLLREQRPGLATLFVSGYSFDHELGLNNSGAPSLFLRKPYNTAELCDHVSRLVQGTVGSTSPL